MKRMPRQILDVLTLQLLGKLSSAIGMAIYVFISLGTK